MSLMRSCRHHSYVFRKATPCTWSDISQLPLPSVNWKLQSPTRSLNLACSLTSSRSVAKNLRSLTCSWAGGWLGFTPPMPPPSIAPHSTWTPTVNIGLGYMTGPIHMAPLLNLSPCSTSTLLGRRVSLTLARSVTTPITTSSNALSLMSRLEVFLWSALYHEVWWPTGSRLNGEAGKMTLSKRSKEVLPPERLTLAWRAVLPPLPPWLWRMTLS